MFGLKRFQAIACKRPARRVQVPYNEGRDLPRRLSLPLYTPLYASIRLFSLGASVPSSFRLAKRVAGLQGMRQRIQNGGQVLVGDVAEPRVVGKDHEIGAFFASVHAAGLADANAAIEAPFFYHGFQDIAQFFPSTGSA